MSNRLIQYGFTAGIVAEELWGQTVLQKYGYGLADCRNYIVSFSGMLVSRPGTLGDTLLPMSIGDNYREFEFVFAEEDANTYLILFVDSKIYFLQQGRFQLEDAKPVTAVANNGSFTQFSCTAHGYSVGDLIEFYGADVPDALVGQTVQVSAVTNVDTFRVTPIGLVGNMDAWVDASTSAVSAYRVYSIASPYAEADLPTLGISQVRDLVEITARGFRPRQLVRAADNTWSISEKTYASGIAAPTGLAYVSSNGTNGESVLFAVTAVDENGQESLPSVPVAMPNGEARYAIDWDAVAGAVRYNVYRSLWSDVSRVSRGLDLGYEQTVFSPYADSYKENTPDFTKTPPQALDPFANQRIRYVDVTAGGSGYGADDLIEFSDSGSGTGASGFPIIRSGVIEAVVIIDGGKDYSGPSITVTNSAGGATSGSGATFSITTNEATGNYPAVSSIHQQRKLYASSANNPLEFAGSQPGYYDNFNRSRVVADDDSFEYDIDSKKLGDILHLISTRVGMLAFTNIGIWNVSSAGPTVTPTDVSADIQTAVGCSGLRPLLIDSDILYGETRNRTIRLLQYNDISKNFGGLDISVLSKELFAGFYDLASWSFESRPYKLVWAARNDGQLLSATISQEQEVYAWARHDTNGLFERNITLPESDREVTYVIAQRYLSGRWVYVLEHFADREASTNEDHCGLDCSTAFSESTTPAATLTLTSTTATASAPVFSSSDVDKYIKYRNGKAIITQYNSTTSVNITIINEFTDILVPYANTYRTIASGDWALYELIPSFQLPLNFRPATVGVYADGKLMQDVAVGAQGLVTFEEDVTAGYIGLEFECLAVTLPFSADGTIIEDSRKNVKGVGIRYLDSKGLEVGTAGDDTYPIETMFSDFFVEATQTKSGHEYVLVSSDWDESTQVYMKSSGALPTQITGLVVDLEVGDEVD